MFAWNKPLPGHAALRIVHSLPVGEFSASEFAIIATNMASIAATGVLIVPSSPVTRPAIMTGQLEFSAVPPRHRPFTIQLADGETWAVHDSEHSTSCSPDATCLAANPRR